MKEVALMRNEMIIYNTDDGLTKVELHLKDGTIWLSQLEIAELFQTSKQNISKHIAAIFADGELDEKAVVNYQLTTANDGKSYNVAFYHLDMILAIGYRVRSARGAQFRRYASTILKEYLTSGFAINDEKVTESLDYYKRLLNRIRDIRSSERLFYQQVLDIFSTSTDYDGKSDIAKRFFQTVQNKMLYAVTGNTAPELIFNRLDASKPFLGLTSFKGNFPHKSDLKISKNLLDETELKRLNLIVSGYLDTAEYQAETRTAMTMTDWASELNRYLEFQRADILEGHGTISRESANQKADEEYEKYKSGNHEITEVDKAFFEALKGDAKKLNDDTGL